MTERTYYLIKRYKTIATSGTSIAHHDAKKPTVLGDCASDQIELAEHEAELALQQSQADGETDTWICVCERDGDPVGSLIVYSTGLSDGVQK